MAKKVAQKDQTLLSKKKTEIFITHKKTSLFSIRSRKRIWEVSLIDKETIVCLDFYELASRQIRDNFDQ